VLQGRAVQLLLQSAWGWQALCCQLAGRHQLLLLLLLPPLQSCCCQ
jgi:hypothetical protein